MSALNKSITLAVKTGKVLFGARTALKNAKTGKVRAIIRASNCPLRFSGDLEYHCNLSDIPLVDFKGTAKDLGMICGKPYAVSVLAIRETGDSDILKVGEGG